MVLWYLFSGTYYLENYIIQEYILVGSVDSRTGPFFKAAKSIKIVKNSMELDGQ